MLVTLLVSGIIIYKKCSKAIERAHQIPLSKPLKLYSALAILIDLALIANLYLNRTWDVTPSPWQELGPSFFWLYLIGTALTLTLGFVIKDHKIKYVITSLHLFATYSVAAIIYPLGFGFDGFTHRATEEWIARFGFITPKLPLYIGQYVVIVFLHKLTAIKLFYLDVFFVPIFSALVLPPLFDRFARRVFNTSRGINTIWFLPFIFFFTFNLTTPFNILIIFTIAGILMMKEYFHGQRTITLPLLISVTGLFIHPLLAAPLLIFTITGVILKKIQNERWKMMSFFHLPSFILYFLFASLLVPLLFMLYIYLTKHTLPTIINPFSKLDLFLNYFHHPYWYAARAPWYFQLLYVWEWLIPIVAILMCVIGFIKDKTKTTLDYLFPLTTLAFWLSGFLLRSWIVFPDVHAMEQGDYPLRLLKTGLLFLLPWGIFSLIFYGEKLWNYVRDRSYLKSVRILGLTVLMITSFLLTLSFYLSYPQWNQKVKFPGYNVSASDFKAVEWIHNDNTDYDYIVLTNPITSVAALQEYSFAKYFKTPQGEISYYSIPSGGSLFSLYTEMWMQGQKRETMVKAMNLVGVKKAYFVIPSYWTHFNSIVEGAKKTANDWKMIDDGKLYIFFYKIS